MAPERQGGVSDQGYHRLGIEVIFDTAVRFGIGF